MAEVDEGTGSLKDEGSLELTGRGGGGTHRSGEDDRRSKK